MTNIPLIDATGTRHKRAGQNARIVSLVPSITELICDLGLAAQLVGRTGFCVHPKALVKSVPKVGGTKSVDIDKVRAASPSHLIVNVDENEKATVEAIAQFVPTVIVTHPFYPLDNVQLYELLGGIFGREREAQQLAQRFRTAYDEVERAARVWPRENVLYLIWRRPWMTVSRDTYISRVLSLVGWETLPVSADRRYPEIELNQDRLRGVARVLLSSEPYCFRDTDVAELAKRMAVPVELIDAEMTSWYGSRAIEGLRYLAALRDSLMHGRAQKPSATFLGENVAWEKTTGS